jgi:hypothetical protein
MSHQKRKTYPELHFDPAIPPELDVLLDPPPVLDKDAAESHQLTFMGFAHVVQPRDFIEWIYVRDAADHRCEVTWLRQLKTRVVRRPRKCFEIELFHGILSSCDAEIKKMEDRIKADLSTKIRQLRGEPDKVKAETEKLEVMAKGDLEAATDKLQLEAWQKMQAHKRAIKGDLQEADFFEQWFEFYVQVDDLLRRAEPEFENDLRRLDEHRQGFGTRLRKAANEMIDGEFEEVHDPAPPEHTPDTKMPTNPATPESASLLFEGSVFQDAEAPIIATTSTETPLSSKSPESQAAEASVPPAASTDVPLSRERSKIEPTDTIGTVETSADAPPSPEVPRLQAGEAAVTATTVIETPLSLESTETPPFAPESLPTERPVIAVASTEVPRSPEEPTQP